MQKILIVIDMQNDFINGIFGTDEGKAIIPKVNELINNKEYNAIYFTHDTHYENDESYEASHLPQHCIYGTKGWQIVPELNSLVGKHINKKTFMYNDFPFTLRKDNIIGYWSPTDNIEFTFCGVCTDICVISNALKLRADFPNSHIRVAANACAGTTPENHEAALKVMKSCLIEVI